MRARSGRSVVAAVFVVLAVLGALPGVAAAAVPRSPAPGAPGDVTRREDDGLATVERYRGRERFDTARLVALDAFGSASTVIVARSDVFADALAASFLAGRLGAPILLTETHALHPDTVRGLAELGAADVILLGGEHAISADTAAAIEALGYGVERLSGVDRYRTAIAAVERAGAGAGTVRGTTTALLANGDAFPDALALGGIAFAEGLPLLLTPQSYLDASTADALADLGVERVLVAGGEAAVSTATVQAVEDLGVRVTRLAGRTRVETALAVAGFATSRLGWSDTTVVVARGDAFPDSLTAGTLAGTHRSVLLLTATPTDAGGAGMTAYLEPRACDVRTVRLIGGYAALSAEVEDGLRAAASPIGDACVLDISPDTGSTVRLDTLQVTVAAIDPLGGPAEDGTPIRVEAYVPAPAPDGAKATRQGQVPPGAWVSVGVLATVTIQGTAIVAVSAVDDDDDIDVLEPDAVAIVACTSTSSCTQGSTLSIGQNLLPANLTTDGPTVVSILNVEQQQIVADEVTPSPSPTVDRIAGTDRGPTGGGGGGGTAPTPVSTLSLTPDRAVRLPGESHISTATYTIDGAPVVGADVVVEHYAAGGAGRPLYLTRTVGATSTAGTASSPLARGESGVVYSLACLAPSPLPAGPVCAQRDAGGVVGDAAGKPVPTVTVLVSTVTTTTWEGLALRLTPAAAVVTLAPADPAAPKVRVVRRLTEAAPLVGAQVVTATLTGAVSGRPAPGVDVRIEAYRSGATPAPVFDAGLSPRLTTDAAGTASYLLASGQPADDLVVGCLLDDDDVVQQADGSVVPVCATPRTADTVPGAAPAPGTHVAIDAQRVSATATVRWLGSPVTITMTPGGETRRLIGEAATHTASVEDAAGHALSGVALRYEQWRGLPGVPPVLLGPGGQADTDADGKATFSSATGLAVGERDVAVVCLATAAACAAGELLAVVPVASPSASAMTTWVGLQVTALPLGGLVSSGVPNSITATVMDTLGAPRAGVPVRFEVFSTEATTPTPGPAGDVVTGTDGTAVFTYTVTPPTNPALPKFDAVHVCLGRLPSTAGPERCAQVVDFGGFQQVQYVTTEIGPFLPMPAVFSVFASVCPPGFVGVPPACTPDPALTCMPPGVMAGGICICPPPFIGVPPACTPDPFLGCTPVTPGCPGYIPPKAGAGDPSVIAPAALPSGAFAGAQVKDPSAQASTITPLEVPSGGKTG